MSRYLIVGDPIVTLANNAYIPDGALIVDGETITAVGPRAELENAGPFEQVLGSRDHIVMPGLHQLPLPFRLRCRPWTLRHDL